MAPDIRPGTWRTRGRPRCEPRRRVSGQPCRRDRGNRHAAGRAERRRPTSRVSAPRARRVVFSPRGRQGSIQTSMAVLLVTNDDGIHAAGLAALAVALEELGEVHVIAPEREQSACGHALTLHRPLRTHGWGDRRWSVNGTPSDCVNLGVLGFLPERPVLIASGINHGSNLGDDVTYSGTVSVARHVAMRVLVSGLPSKTLLNVNVPAGTVKGIRVTRLGHRVYSGKIVEQADPRGRAHYWIGAGPPAWEALDGTDMGAVHEGHAAVTPLHLDLTHHRALAQMTEWEPALNAALRARPRGERAPTRK